MDTILETILYEFWRRDLISMNDSLIFLSLREYWNTNDSGFFWKMKTILYDFVRWKRLLRECWSPNANESAVLKSSWFFFLENGICFFLKEKPQDWYDFWNDLFYELWRRNFILVNSGFQISNDFIRFMLEKKLIRLIRLLKCFLISFDWYLQIKEWLNGMDHELLFFLKQGISWNMKDLNKRIDLKSWVY